MCLILLAFQQHPAYPVILAANRDEFYARPARPAHFWDDAPHMLAGRDEEARGTWCGVNLGRSFAAVTNFREPPRQEGAFLSRGDLVADFLRQDPPPETYLANVRARADRYRGFNLLLGDASAIYYYSNRDGGVRQVEPGVHGLSNDLLNVPWFKVEQGRAELSQLIDSDRVTPAALFDILADEKRAADADLPDTGFGRAWERVLSPRFIRTDDYGTRCSTIILIANDGTVIFQERTFGEEGAVTDEQHFVLRGATPVAHTG